MVATRERVSRKRKTTLLQPMEILVLDGRNIPAVVASMNSLLLLSLKYLKLGLLRSLYRQVEKSRLCYKSTPKEIVSSNYDRTGDKLPVFEY